MPARGESTPRGDRRRPTSEAPRPTRRGLLFLLSAVVCFVLARVFTVRELVFVACLLLVLPILGLILVGVRRLQIEVVRRTDPEIIEAGRPARVWLRFANRAGLASPTVRWADLYDDLELPESPSFLPPIRGFRRTVEQTAPTVDVDYRLPAPVRGRHTFGPVLLRVADPFGMVARTAEIGARESITVTPRVFPVGRTSAELVPGVGSDKYAGRMGPAGEVDVLARKYQTGDSMRRVNWPATARHGELMVRQDDQHGAKDAVIIVDSDPASFPGTSSPLRDDDIEWAISVACSVALHVLVDGYNLAFAASFRAAQGTARSVRLYGTADQARILLDAATIARETSRQSQDLGSVLAASLGQGAGGRTVVAVLGARSSASLLPDLPRDGGGGFAIVVVPERPDIPAQPALDLERELSDAGWRVRLAVSGESLAEIWQELTGKVRA